ncbi:MAG: hypothetical protein KF770_10325 [Anaerolineae bacterium]|nr:hypothetical protein [Anaerolineae bacterium]
MIWLRVGAVVLLLTAVSLFLLIALGVFDPKPVGELAGTAVPHTLAIPPGEQTIRWLPEPLPAGDFTVRATVTHQSGELDSGAGLVLTDGCTAVIVALSPLGYTTIHQTPPTTDHCSPITDYRLPITELPWQPWPHVRPGDAANEIWLDVVDGQMRVRLNRELLWAGDLPIRSTTVGIVGESFGDTAVFHFSPLVFSHD